MIYTLNSFMIVFLFCSIPSFMLLLYFTLRLTRIRRHPRRIRDRQERGTCYQWSRGGGGTVAGREGAPRSARRARRPHPRGAQLLAAVHQLMVGFLDRRWRSAASQRAQVLSMHALRDRDLLDE